MNDKNGSNGSNAPLLIFVWFLSLSLVIHVLTSADVHWRPIQWTLPQFPSLSKLFEAMKGNFWLQLECAMLPLWISFIIFQYKIKNKAARWVIGGVILSLIILSAICTIVQ